VLGLSLAKLTLSLGELACASRQRTLSLRYLADTLLQPALDIRLDCQDSERRRGARAGAEARLRERSAGK